MHGTQHAEPAGSTRFLPCSPACWVEAVWVSTGLQWFELGSIPSVSAPRFITADNCPSLPGWELPGVHRPHFAESLGRDVKTPRHKSKQCVCLMVAEGAFSFGADPSPRRVSNSKGWLFRLKRLWHAPLRSAPLAGCRNTRCRAPG